MTSGVSDGSDPKRSIKSAERALDLLECVAGNGTHATFKMLGDSLDIPKSSLHGLLDVLVGRGYLSLDAHTRSYKLGIRVLELGHAYKGQNGVAQVAQRFLEAIVAAVNETAHLAELSGTENVYLAKVDSQHALRMQSDIGMRRSAHSTGVGKALLAQLNDTEVASRYGGGALPVLTPNTISHVDQLRAELAAIRKRGFAFDNEEGTPGIFCLAVPVHSANSSVLALSVAIPTTRANPAALPNILRLLAEASCGLTAQIGWQCDSTLLSLKYSENAQAAITNLIMARGEEFAFVDKIRAN